MGPKINTTLFVLCLFLFSFILSISMEHANAVDTGATDNDNDGLVNHIEKTLGSDPNNSSDVLKVTITGKTRYLIDTNRDGKSDKFFDAVGRITTVGNTDAGKYLIDLDGDTTWDYIYDPVSKTVTVIEKASTTEFQFPWLLVLIGGIIVIVIVVITVLFKLGYISIYEEIITETPENIKPKIKKKSLVALVGIILGLVLIIVVFLVHG